MLLYRSSRPYIATLGRQPGTAGGYGDVLRHPNAQPIPDLTLLRLDAPCLLYTSRCV